MITFIHDPNEISLTLDMSNVKNFEIGLRERIQSIPSAQKYSKKLMDLVLKALDPNPARRATIKQLIALIEKNVKRF